jgi:uracil-DNA glycosylase
MALREYYQKTSHPEWHALLDRALASMSTEYLCSLLQDPVWLPGLEQVFAAFHLPLAQTHYVLLGESPYPRKHSANGYAFWDNAVEGLWSEQGLSKPVNRATSLRNIMKMLLLARGDLTDKDTSQQAIAQLDKSTYTQSASQFFEGMMSKGILLLNASLVYSEGKVPYHARHWKPFMQSLLEQLALIKPTVQLILLGKMAGIIPPNNLPVGLMAEHPYNISFINNPNVLQFFQPLDLLAHD